MPRIELEISSIMRLLLGRMEPGYRVEQMSFDGNCVVVTPHASPAIFDQPNHSCGVFLKGPCREMRGIYLLVEAQTTITWRNSRILTSSENVVL